MDLGFFNQLSAPLKTRLFNYSLVALTGLMAVACQMAGPARDAVPVEPKLRYPVKVTFDDDRYTSGVNALSSMLKAENATYEEIRIDSLSGGVQLLQYGQPGLNIFTGDSLRGITHDAAALDSAFRTFLTKYHAIFLTKSSQLSGTGLIESTDFVELTYRKSYPSDYSFSNREMNTLKIVISRFGEIGQVESTLLPDLEIPLPAWKDQETIRQSLVQHKIDYQKDGRTQVYVIQAASLVGSGNQQALVAVRRRQDLPGTSFNARTTELRYHYVWAFDVFQLNKKDPQFIVFADAYTGEVVESRFIGGK